MREVGTTICCEQMIVGGRDGAGVDIYTLNQVVDKDKK